MAEQQENPPQPSVDVEKNSVQPELIGLDAPLTPQQYVVDVEISQARADAIKAALIQRQRDVQQDETRSSLAKAFVGIFAGTLVFSGILTAIVAFHPNADKELVKNWFNSVLTIQVGFVSAGLGYYFGSQKR
jgi:hypothetical protein